jgi:putative transposase
MPHQQKRELRTKGSIACKRLTQRIARLHQKIARQRYQFHCETANLLLSKANAIFTEDLNVANLVKRCKPKQDADGTFLPNGQAAKSGLNKSFADAGISQFVNQILPFKAERAGKRTIDLLHKSDVFWGRESGVGSRESGIVLSNQELDFSY